MGRHNRFDRRPQPAFCSVPDNRSSDFTGNRKTDPDKIFIDRLFRPVAVTRFCAVLCTRCRGDVSVKHLENKTRSCPFAPGARDLQEFAPPLKPLRRLPHGSGGQPFAPSGPAGGQNTPATDSCFARAETVAPFAHEYAGLKSTFHDITPLEKTDQNCGRCIEFQAA